MSLKMFIHGVRAQKGLDHFHVREYGAVLVFTLVVFFVLIFAPLAALGVPWIRDWPEGLKTALYGAFGFGSLAIAYGALIEPFILRARYHTLRSEKIQSSLKILHLSDIHVRTWSRVEDQILEHAERARPDLILITGDMTSVPCDVADAKKLIVELLKIAPVRLIRGDSERRLPPYRTLTEGTEARWLENESEIFEINGQKIWLGGVQCADEKGFFSVAQGKPEDLFAICMYHYPDFFEEIAKLPYDLTLSGHTHGGQIRLPLIGALISGARSGTRFARGLFQENGRWAFTHSGIGCESYGLPRLRFFCPPETVLFTLAPK